MQMRQKHYIQQQQERTLKKGDCVAVLGRGIAVVERVDEEEGVLIFGNRLVSKFRLKEIVLSRQNSRWEYGIRS